MLYELGLQATFAVSLWLLVDLFGARGPRSRRLPIMSLAGTLAVWVLGEQLIARAETPGQLQLGRAVLHMGVSLLPVAWLWTGAVLARSRWFERAPWLVLVAGVPLIAGYTFLFSDPQGQFFIDTTSRAPQHGSGFFVYAGYAWLLIAIGTIHFLVAARRLPKSRPLRIAAIVLAGTVPLAGNVLHVSVGFGAADPTPLLMGAAGVALRLSLLDSGLVAVLPLGQRSVLDQLHTGVILSDLEGIVVDANTATRRLLGRRRLAGRQLDALLDDARRDASRVIEVEKAPLRGRLGEVGFAALLTDRTDAARLERRLAERERLESLGLLAGGIAHDFNNLLTGISSHAAAARDALRPDSPAVEPIRDALHGVRVASHLTAQLLAYAGRGRFDTKTLDLSAAVRELAKAITGSLPESVQLEVAVAGDLPPIDAGSAQVQQVLMNLVLNGAEAIDGKGVIGVRTHATRVDAPERLDLVPGHTMHAGHHVVLEVRDNGCGMDEETRQRIFEPFVTTKSSGHGLGLAATLGLVHRHGGGIEVESQPGVGSVFRVYFPAATSPAARRPPSATPRGEVEGGAQRARILVVDDEDYVREAVCLTLDRIGHSAVSSGDGAAAVDLVRADPEGVDLVLLDLGMPGMSGEETFHALRAIRPDLRVLLSSGFAEQEPTRSLAQQAGVDFLAKPYDPDALGAAVTRLLDARS